MISFLLLLTPFILILLISLSGNKARILNLVLLLAYTIVTTILILNSPARTLFTAIGLAALTVLALYSIIYLTVETFLLVEGRGRRRGRFVDLLGRYGR